jgi:hypothetical protein
MHKPRDMADVFAEYDAEQLEKARAEIAAEDAVWTALPQAERDRITAEREAKWAVSEDEDEDERDAEDVAYDNEHMPSSDHRDY